MYQDSAQSLLVMLLLMYPFLFLANNQPQTQLQQFRILLQNISQAAYNTLKFLMTFLVLLTKNSAHNQMEPKALGIVFAPCLFRYVYYIHITMFIIISTKKSMPVLGFRELSILAIAPVQLQIYKSIVILFGGYFQVNNFMFLCQACYNTFILLVEWLYLL